MATAEVYTLLVLLLLVLLQLETGMAEAGVDAPTQVPPVDIVYAWVNGSDPNFQQRFRQYTQSSISCDRVESSNELLMGLTAICKHQRWVRQVFIVVDQQQFSLDFLPPGCPPVSFVDLSTFVPQQYLSTFNSHVFETFLWRIPGLAEHFMYMNDDIILARPIIPANLFKDPDAAAAAVSTAAGSGVQSAVMRVNLEAHPFHDYSQVPGPEAEVPKNLQWLWPRYNGLDLFKGAFSNASPAGFDAHSAVLLSKQAMEKTWELFGSRLDGPLAHNKKRHYASLKHGGDVHFTSLAQQVGVQLGLMINKSPFKAWVVGHAKTNALAKYTQAMFNSRAHVLCLQDLRRLSGEDLAKLCTLVSEAWCATATHTRNQQGREDRCGVFVQMCSNRGAHCVDDRRLSLLMRH